MAKIYGIKRPSQLQHVTIMEIIFNFAKQCKEQGCCWANQFSSKFLLICMWSFLIELIYGLDFSILNQVFYVLINLGGGESVLSIVTQ